MSSNMAARLFIVILALSFCTDDSRQMFLERPILSGPAEALVKQVADFQCEIPNPKNQSILLQLFKRGERDDMLGEYTLLKGEEVAVIPKVIKHDHEGFLECVARVQNNSEILPTVSNAYFLKVIEPVKNAAVVVSGPSELYEGRELKLRCQLKAGNHETYKWWHDDRFIAPSPSHELVDDGLVIRRVTSMDNGSYVCEASNVFNNSKVFTAKSLEVVIKVKELVSAPDVSFSVLKGDDQSYVAAVACRSERGAPPITFSLYNSSELVQSLTTEEKQASFTVPGAMNHLVQLRCQANNGDKTAVSRWLPLEVVPVAAPVEVDYRYDMADDYAVIGLRLCCSAARGSHPRFRWYHNNVPLKQRGSYYQVYDQPPQQSSLLLAVGGRSAGRYHCRVWDSFDNSSSMTSSRRYVDEEVLNRLPDVVVAVVFGSFTVLILLVSFCCLTGVMFRRGQDQKKLNLEMEMVLDENELDSSGFSEDPDVVGTAREDGFDQTSQVSEDEWPLMEQEKKTLEDQPVSETF